MSLSGYCVNILLVPGPVFFCVVFSRFSFHQVPAFSGRRLVWTVSTSPLFVSPCCPLVPEIDFVVSPYSFVARSSLSLLPLCFGVSCPFLFPASLSLLFFLCLLFLSSLLLTPLAADWSGLSGLSLLLSPFPSFCFLLHPQVLCLVFLAADWSGFPAQPHLLLPSLLTSLIPDLLSRRDLRLSVIFLAADWSEYHIAGSPVKQSLLQTRHVLWPQTGPGRCCSPHTHGTPHKTTSRAVMD